MKEGGRTGSNMARGCLSKRMEGVEGECGIRGNSLGGLSKSKLRGNP